MTKVPKFFCESCGSEVKQNAKFCPHCGKFFASVKCPSCGFAGDSPMFRDGCPACGYAVYKDRAHTAAPSAKKKEETDPLPWWIYVVSIALLAVVALLILTR